jgi:preprotein translocase subunit SecG
VVTFLSILLSITSILMIVLVLLHKGKGGGLSTMFGGGVSSSLGGSAVVEKNLDRLTIICGLVWVVCIIALGLLLKETGPAVL